MALMIMRLSALLSRKKLKRYKAFTFVAQDYSRLRELNNDVHIYIYAMPD